jgi:hypothetical protein
MNKYSISSHAYQWFQVKPKQVTPYIKSTEVNKTPMLLNLLKGLSLRINGATLFFYRQKS